MILNFLLPFMARSAHKYNLYMRLMHWIVGSLVMMELALGIYMTDYAELDFKPSAYGIHKSLGVLVLILSIIRIVLRFSSKLPQSLPSINRVEIALAKVAVFLLYAFMIMMPISGYLMSNYYGRSVSLFGIELPVLVAPDYDLGKDFSMLHFFFSWILLLVVIAHVLYVLKHYLFDKQNLLRRIM